MSHTRSRIHVVSESRAYDTHYDPVFTTNTTTATSNTREGHAIYSDRRVASVGENAISGNNRYKYFRRPVMPRTSAVPTNILMAPTATQNPLEPIDDVQTSPTKDAEVQTMFRESEAQTVPYAPNYVVRPGESPMLLLMADMNVGSGLPVGPKEVFLIELTAAKRDLEASMPPFTDEASMLQRRRLMEQQEVKEMRLRESEMDALREARIELLERALQEREESAEFATAQRVETLRAKLLAERERKLQHVRNKRIRVLRRLTQARGKVDPLLSDSAQRDIVGEYSDKGSSVYAPRVRDGKIAPLDPKKLDVASRTATLTNMENVAELEASLPRDETSIDKLFLNKAATGQLTATTMAGQGSPSRGGSAAEPRLTSAGQRALRTAKKDVETMSKILAQRKKSMHFGDMERPRALIAMPALPFSTSTSATATGTGSAGLGATDASAAVSRAKVRPPTPDLTRNRDERAIDEQEQVAAATILLQTLLRGRASQNASYEGRYRRAELISALREVTAELERSEDEAARTATSERLLVERDVRIHDSSVDAAIGGITSTLIAVFAEEYKLQHPKEPEAKGTDVLQHASAQDDIPAAAVAEGVAADNAATSAEQAV